MTPGRDECFILNLNSSFQDHTSIPVQSIIFMTTSDSSAQSLPNPKVLHPLVSLEQLGSLFLFQCSGSADTVVMERSSIEV